MPLCEQSSYTPPRFLTSGHAQTVWASLTRRVAGVTYRRERIETPDGDFLDLDWSPVGSPKLVIVSHGFEGNASQAYVQGMVKALHRRGFDVLAWSFRGLSGEPNRLLRTYHAGDSGDLETVIRHALSQQRYRTLDLVGFSLGGGQILKFIGERASDVPKIIRRAVTISVPCHLASSAAKFTQMSHRVYMYYFLRRFHRTLSAKEKIMPDQLSTSGFWNLKNFHDLDNRYTAPIHGFQDAHDYWAKASCKPFLPDIRIPTLLLNAKDDPFLAAESYPMETARTNPHLFLETPAYGGHVGFVAFNDHNEYWSETRAGEFLQESDS
ncbi:MAG: alpha/beta fold hydrolase [Deltaproteobacteria bacterium]|nr:alpha/beta fold hydrolase [Deltaproteobacteria bacterium]